MIDIIFSINVHENIVFLVEQLENIHFFTSHLNIVIAYNCNEFMLKELQNYKFESYENLKIIINPISIEKNRWHGSLCKGIIKNMEYIKDKNIKFEHFIALSSRNILKSKLNLEDIELKYKKYYNEITNLVKDNRRFYFNKHNKFFICDGSKQDYWHGDMTSSRNWFWGKVKNSFWFQELDKKVKFFIGGRHEGLCIPYEVVLKIVDFTTKNEDIMNSCYKYSIALEEVIPQVLACNFCTNNKMYTLLEPPFIKVKRTTEDVKQERAKWEK